EIQEDLGQAAAATNDFAHDISDAGSGPSKQIVHDLIQYAFLHRHIQNLLKASNNSPRVFRLDGGVDLHECRSKLWGEQTRHPEVQQIERDQSVHLKQQHRVITSNLGEHIALVQVHVEKSGPQ